MASILAKKNTIPGGNTTIKREMCDLIREYEEAFNLLDGVDVQFDLTLAPKMKAWYKKHGLLASLILGIPAVPSEEIVFTGIEAHDNAMALHIYSIGQPLYTQLKTMI